MTENKNFLAKIKSKSILQQIIDRLTDAMISKELRPGDKLPTEMELAESLGVGRNSVREAIKVLEWLGVLEIRRPEGTFVTEGFSESMIDPLLYGIILDTSDSYDSIMELRELFEVGVLRLAITKCTDVEPLRKKLDNLKREIYKGEENIENAFIADNEFHDLIAEMGENSLVSKINRVVRVLTHSLRYDSVKRMIETGRGEELFEAHQRLFNQFLNKDAEDMNRIVRGTYFTADDE